MFASNLPGEISDQTLFEQSQEQFDYAALDTEARIITKQRASEIKSLMRQSLQNMIDIGQKLLEVKQELKHGQFENWLSIEVDLSRSTAQRFMQIARQFKSVKLTDLRISSSALYELAATSAPAGARQEVIERAKQGEIITYAKAKSIVAQHKLSKPEAKQSTVDTPAETVEREASHESFEKPVEAHHTVGAKSQKPVTVDVEASTLKYESTELSPDDGELGWIEPTRYATPTTTEKVEVELIEQQGEQHKQELSEDQSLEQQTKEEPTTEVLTSYETLQQEDQIKKFQAEIDEQSFEVAVGVQPVERDEAQLSKPVEELAQEHMNECLQETLNHEYQPEGNQVHEDTDLALMVQDAAVNAPLVETVEIQAVEVVEKADSGARTINSGGDQGEDISNKDPVIAKLTVEEDVAVTANLEPQPAANIGDRSSEDSEEVTQKAATRWNEHTTSKTLEFFDGVSNLKFCNFDKVAKQITAEIDFRHIDMSEIFNQEQFDEIWGGIASHIPPINIAVQLPVNQRVATCSAIASLMSHSELVAFFQEFTKCLSQQNLEQLINISVNELNLR